MSDNVITLIQNKYDKFSKGHKKIADYIIANYENAVFMTADKLGKASNTSEATVVRFATNLGFANYGSFIDSLSENLKESLDKKKDISFQVKTSNIPDALKAIFEKDISNLGETLAYFDLDAFNQAIDNIVSARNVYIIGLRAQEPLAGVLSMYLNIIRDGINLLSSNVTSEIYEKMLHINENDVLISFGLPDYSVRTLKAMEFANVKKAKIISITDSVYSPMTMYTSCVLTAKCDMTDDYHSMTSAMSLVNAIVLAVMNKTGSTYRNNLNSLDETLENMNG